MESDLETRWQRSVEERNLTLGELEIMVAEMERGGSIPDNWNQRMILSLAREKTEVKERYGIKICQTTISCAGCGRPWGYGGHNCSGQSRDRKKVDSGLEMENLALEAVLGA